MMVHKSVFAATGAAVLVILAAFAFSLTTHGVHTTRIATSHSGLKPLGILPPRLTPANSATVGFGSYGQVTIIKMPVTHHAHPVLAAALLAAALAVAGLTVWWARNPREAA